MSPGTSLAVQRLRLGLSRQGVWIWSLVGELRSQQASQPKNQNIKQKQYCNTFNKNFKNGPHQNNLLKKMSPNLVKCPPGGNLALPLHPHSESLRYGNIPGAQFSVFTEGLVGSISFLRSPCPLTGNIPDRENQERSGWHNKPFCFPLQGYAFALHLDSHWFRNWWPSDASKCQMSD